MEFTRANIIKELERAQLWKRRKRRGDGVYNAGFEIEADSGGFRLRFVPAERTVETPEQRHHQYAEVLRRFGWHTRVEADCLRVWGQPPG